MHVSLYTCCHKNSKKHFPHLVNTKYVSYIALYISLVSFLCRLICGLF